MRRSDSRPRFWCGSSVHASLPQRSARALTVVAVALFSATLASAACSGSERPAHAEPPPSAQVQRERKPLGVTAQEQRERRTPSERGQSTRGASAPEALAATEPPNPEGIEGGAQTQLHACSASPISASTQQLVVVTSASWGTWHATLQRFEREDAAAAWRKVGEPTPAVLGRAGYAWGDGLHGSGAPAGRSGPVKREGDMRSPAGVFALGTVHGYAPAAPSGMALPYRQADAALRCVDDPRSAQYNRIVEPGVHGETWSSAERMRREDAAYELALDIEHNRSPVVAGHGSCIFAHVWVNAETPVAGCTGMALPMLRQVLTWIRPGALWVALPVQEYEALRACWKLPDRPTL